MRLINGVAMWEEAALSLRVPELNQSRRALELEQAVRTAMLQVLLTPRAERRVPERRQELRCPFPYPIRLTPLDEHQQPMPEQSVIVIGRNLSVLGFDFYHYAPLAFRHVIATFENPGGSALQVVLELTWCRFNRHGFYDSGGRFLEALPSPLNEPQP